MGYKDGVVLEDIPAYIMGTSEGAGSYKIRCLGCGRIYYLGYWYTDKEVVMPRFCPYCGEPLTEEGSE